MDNASDDATQWDMFPDGQHFIIDAAADSLGKPDAVSVGQQIHVVLNWFTELQQRVPIK